MLEDPIANMRDRVVQFRRLADLTHDSEMRVKLRGWANDIEADVRRLTSERGQTGAL
jgi:hypothetical protein